MSKIDRVSPTLSGRRSNAMPLLMEQLRIQRRPNLSSVLDGSPENVPASTKHTRQVSSICQGVKKIITIKQPQPTKVIDKMPQKVVNKLSPTSGQGSAKNLNKKGSVKHDSKENIVPNSNVGIPMNVLSMVQKIGFTKSRQSSYSQHDSDLNQNEIHSQKQQFNQVESKKVIRVTAKTLSLSQEHSLKNPPLAPKMELDLQCRERNQSQFKTESSVVIKTQETRSPDSILSDFKTIDSCGFDEDTLMHLYKREQVYQVTPNYERMQPHINMVMRGVLIDWVTEVCKEFTLKRETLHLAIHNLDRFLARKEGIPRTELQLVGIAALYIACKIEEIYPPKVSDFSQASNYGFTTKQILEKELEMCRILKWFLNPPTLYLWSTWYMSQWDLFVTQSQKLSKSQLFLIERTYQFKLPNQQSYILFRQYMNLLDCSIIDIKTFNFGNREIVASLLFLITLKQHIGINLPKLHEILTAKVIIKDVLAYQSIFQEFIEMCFGMSMSHISKCIRYLTPFLALEMVIAQPGTSKIPQEKELEERYEYFLSIQTHSSNNLAFVRPRITK